MGEKGTSAALGKAGSFLSSTCPEGRNMSSYTSDAMIAPENGPAQKICSGSRSRQL